MAEVGAVVVGGVEPHVPGDAGGQDRMVGGKTPVLALVQGHHGGTRRAWQAQQIF